MDAEQVAQLLAVPVSWVRAETRAGRLPHLALGRYRRYDREAALEWLAEQRAGKWRTHEPRVRV
jgi:excisionase family DNA binding protein